jgi:predicted dehydrogenase
MLVDGDIDAVFLVSPNSFHGPQSIAALRAGKHVFCEKPVCTSFAEFRAQLELARANPHLCTYVDYILYFDAFEQRLRRMTADGLFGMLTQVQVNYRHPVNIAGDKVWKLREPLMGDAIGMGINHALSVMLFAMAPQARPAGVYATSMPAQRRAFEAPPIWNIQVRFDSGASGFIFGNIDSGKGYDAYHSFYGTHGALVFDSLRDRAQQVRYWSEVETGGEWIHPLDPERCRRDGVGELAWPAGTSTPVSGNVLEHQTAECVGHFLECVRTGTPSPLGFVDSAPVAELGWGALLSAKLGREVALPLDHEEAARELA